MDFSDVPDEVLKAAIERQVALQNPATLGAWLLHTFRLRAHTRLIGRELEALVMPGGPRRLMILSPPQVGKSTLVGELLPLWWQTLFPQAKVIVGSYGSALSIKRGRAVRRLVREHGEKLGLALDPESRAQHDWSLMSGGGMRCVGVGGSLTGHAADLAICDDPHKDRAEADSKHVRDVVDDWWSSTFLSRLSPDAPVVLVMTPWHEDDLRGRLLAREGDAWRVLRLPALADDPADPLGRDEGDPLSHPKVSDGDVDALRGHWHSRRARTSVRDWGALYQCDPQPVEGALLHPSVLEAAKVPVGAALPDALRVAVAVDPSGGGRDEAGIITGFLGADDRCYITGDHTGRMSSIEWAEKAVLVAFETAADVMYVETNFGGDMATNQIRQAYDALVDAGALDEGWLLPRVEQVRAKYGKRIRASPAAQAFVEGRVRLVGLLPDFVRQWGTWQEGSRESPGRIDAGTYLIQGLLRSPWSYRGKVSSPVGVELDVPDGYRGIEIGLLPVGCSRARSASESVLRFSAVSMNSAVMFRTRVTSGVRALMSCPRTAAL